MANTYPTHCPHCRKFVTGISRSFCPNCNEVFDECDVYWFSTEAHEIIEVDGCFSH
jgi:hypothetical protein